MKNIHRHILLLLLLFPLLSFSQQVENIHFEQAGKQIHIYYDLQGEGTYNVKVFCSTDDGYTWGEPLQKVTGAIGENQQPGTNKKIVWNVLAEREKIVGDIVFKVIAFKRINKEKQVVKTYSENGNIYVKYKNGEVKKLTSSGVDEYPVFYDNENIIFCRKTGNEFEEYGATYIEAKLMMINISSMNSKELVIKDSFGNKSNITLTGGIMLSPNKNYLYFETIGYSVAGALEQYSFKTNVVKEITSFNIYQIIKTGKYKNYLLVFNSYFNHDDYGEMIPGRQWQWYLKNEKGEVVKELGSNKNARKFLDEYSSDKLENYWEDFE